MMKIDNSISYRSLGSNVADLFRVAANATRRLRDRWDPREGAPVFTVDGRYTSRGWTEWTQGFVFGNAILLYDATSDRELLQYGREQTLEKMAVHVSHIGVHDHGFNNVSTYGNLLRLFAQGRLPDSNPDECEFFRLALKISGAVQAARWTELPGDIGYIYSFNGAHSLFADTIRSLRSLALSHKLGHTLLGEQDAIVSLLRRLLQHAETTARYNVYLGTGRDAYDVRGRVAHESIFNTGSGAYRCPSSQQGYSPFSTWTRGHAWILCGFAEQLEFLETLTDEQIAELGLPYFSSLEAVISRFLEVATATADFAIENSPTDGVPYWDTGAPGLARLGNYLDRAADPFNRDEPVDSSAAAIAAQGLLRLGAFLGRRQARDGSGIRYTRAGLTIARTLFSDPYLAREPRHEGILLHAVYHRPNGWDHVRPGQAIPNGESCMWGDYHALELAAYIQRMAALGEKGANSNVNPDGVAYPAFFQIDPEDA